MRRNLMDGFVVQLVETEMSPETQNPHGSVRPVTVMRKAGYRECIETAWERLFVAVNYLASASGSIQYRLDCAYSRCLAPLMRAELPEAIRAELHQVIAILAGTDNQTNEQAIRQNIGRLREADAKEAARRIVSLFNLVARCHPLETDSGMLPYYMRRHSVSSTPATEN